MPGPDAMSEICFLPATELAARIRRRELSPVEVVEAYLRRIEARNPVINAYTLVLGDQAMDAARKAEAAVMAGGPLGPLHGVPVAHQGSRRSRRRADLDGVARRPRTGCRSGAPWRSSGCWPPARSCSARPTFRSSGTRASPTICASGRPARPGRSATMPAALPAAAPRRSPTAWRRSRRAPTAAARCAFPPPSAARSASSRRSAASLR